MKIVLACGGTGGHIFPALSVAEELKKRNPAVDILYVCGNRDIESAIFRIVPREKMLSIESAPFRGARSLLDPRFLIKLITGFFQALRLFLREKPRVVVGFGGYYSFPAIMAAKFVGARTLLHEQNVFPGKANRQLSRWVDGVALSFAETEKFLAPHGNRRVTGNPIRAGIEKECRNEALDFFGFTPEKATLLVLGGSQGAESINTLFLESLAFLTDDFKNGVQALHLCGKLAPEASEEACRKAGLRCRAYSFFERMDLAYGAADFAVGRAGATFLAEIRFKKIPAILIPYPFADGHQRMNAAAFAAGSEAVVAEQAELTAERMAGILETYYQSIKKRGGARPPAAPRENARVLLAEFIESESGKN